MVQDPVPQEFCSIFRIFRSFFGFFFSRQRTHRQYCKNCTTGLCEQIYPVDHRFEQRGNEQVCIWCGFSTTVGCTHEHTHRQLIPGQNGVPWMDQEYAVICDQCQATVQTVTVPGHTCDFVRVPEENKAPTCTEEGYEKYTCSICGAPLRSMIAMLDHVWIEVADGTTICSSCGEIRE